MFCVFYDIVYNNELIGRQIDCQNSLLSFPVDERLLIFSRMMPKSDDNVLRTLRVLCMLP